MGDFDLRLWLMKGVKKALLLGAAAAASAGAEYVELNPLPTEYIVYGGLAIIVLEWVANAIKHMYME